MNLYRQQNHYALLQLDGPLASIRRLSNVDMLQLKSDCPFRTASVFRSGAPQDLPELEYVVSHPILTEDNDIVAVSGYDRLSKTYLHLRNTVFPEVMTNEQAVKAVGELLERDYQLKPEHTSILVAAVASIACQNLLNERPPKSVFFRYRGGVTILAIQAVVTAALSGRCPEILMASLSIVKNFVDDGSPPHGLPPIANCPNFCKLIRGAAFYATGVDPFANCLMNTQACTGHHIYGSRLL